MQSTAELRTNEPSKFLFWAAVVLAVTAAILGGQGDGNAARELVIQLTALVLLIAILASPRMPVEPLGRWASRVLTAMFALTALHLVPLPYNLWAALTPSETAKEVLTGFGLAQGWRPFSLVPHETMANLFLLVPPAIAYLAAVRMDAKGRERVAILIMSIAGFSVLLGLGQYASGTQTLYLYDQVNRGFGVGLFSNRNHQADLAIIGWLMAAAFFSQRNARFKDLPPIILTGIFIVASVFFVLGVLATGSRGGFLLSGFAGAAIFSMRFERFGVGMVGALAAVGTMAATIVALGAFLGSRLFAATISRFEADDDARLQIWPEVVRMTVDNMPLGSGIGSFQTYYRYAEPLDQVKSKFVNSAHNEYLEIAMEAGVPGLLLVMAGLCVLGLAAFRLLTERTRKVSVDRQLRILALVGIVVVLAHSTFDYPLRTTTLSVIFAFLCGLILSPRRDSSEPNPKG